MTDASGARSVLLTGPSGRTAPWERAALSAGWTAITRELLEVAPETIELGPRPDWVLVASANAMPALEPHRAALAGARYACVGGSTFETLSRWGLGPGLGPFSDRARLVAALGDELAPGVRVLVPRGDLSDELARAAAALGALVHAPIAYRVRARVWPTPLPVADAVLFASPSCVRAWVALAPAADTPPRAALALGPATARALDRLARLDPPRIGPILVLSRPEPAALAHELAALSAAW